MPVGTANALKDQLSKSLQVDSLDSVVSVVNMPEFLAEGSAINDLVNPQRVVIGTKNETAFKIIARLVPDVKIIRTHDTGSSELGKLLCNAMLAQRVSSMNAITELCEQTPGCDISDVRQIVESDSRIGSKYLQCSLGFGGSCFEKDIQSLVYILASNGMTESALYWQSVLDINNRQKLRVAKNVTSSIKQGSKLAIFGFSYKKNTSDTRSTPVAAVVSYLLDAGFSVSVHDP